MDAFDNNTTLILFGRFLIGFGFILDDFFQHLCIGNFCLLALFVFFGQFIDNLSFF